MRSHRKFLLVSHFTFRDLFLLMDPILIQFFKAAVPGGPAAAKPQELVADALSRGLLIPPSLINRDVEIFVSLQPKDLNSTFYKRWQDVVEKNRLELFLDQIRHYVSTYGTGHTQAGNGYVPNDGSEAPDFSEYTVITPIGEDELYKRCLSILQGGAALKSRTVAALCQAVTDYLAAHPNAPFDIDSIRNREGLSILCKALGRRPSAPVELLRYIIYETTGQSLLIQSDDMLQRIRVQQKPYDFSQLTQAELDGLASIFYRFKNLFLAFRTQEYHDAQSNEWVVRISSNRPIINRLRRAAVRLHVPMRVGFWESVLAGDASEEEVRERLDGVSNFKLVTLLQAIRERLLLAPGDQAMYPIRNGSVWFREAPERDDRHDYLRMLERILHERLVRNLSSKACSVRFPEDLTLTCPASEKNFIGNLPFGSSYPLAENNFFGIYWRAEWGTDDLDLSFMDWKGSTTGWNEQYNTGETVYSGDMTDADPEAVELIYCKGRCPNGTVYVNRYSGEPGSRFQFFFGQQEIVDMHENYMVDPNSVLIREELLADSREKMVALVCGGRIWLCDFGVGESRVSDGDDAGVKEAVLARKAHCFLPLRDILLEAGFRESNHPELDFRDLKKDSLLSLFA